MNELALTDALFVVFCTGVVYTGFCRLVVMTGATTAPAVSAAIWCMTVTAAFGVFSVLDWGYRPDLPSVMLSAAAFAVQLATSRAWRNGLPSAYRRAR